MLRVGDKAVARVIGELCSLGFNMGTLRAKGIHRCDVEMLQDIEHQDSGRALTVGRVLQQVDAFVMARNRIGGGGLGCCKILGSVNATLLGESCDHVLCNLAAVKGIAALVGDAAQHFGLTRSAEDLAHARRASIDQICVAGAALKGAGVIPPVKGHTRRDGHAFFCVVNGWGQHGIEADLTFGFRQMTKGVDRAGDRDSIGCIQGNCLQAARTQCRCLCRLGRASRAVQRPYCVFACTIVKNKTIAADPSHLWFADTEQNSPSDRSIHGVAAAL